MKEKTAAKPRHCTVFPLSSCVRSIVQFYNLTCLLLLTLPTGLGCSLNSQLSLLFGHISYHHHYHYRRHYQPPARDFFLKREMPFPLLARLFTSCYRSKLCDQLFSQFAFAFRVVSNSCCVKFPFLYTKRALYREARHDTSAKRRENSEIFFFYVCLFCSNHNISIPVREC